MELRRGWWSFRRDEVDPQADDAAGDDGGAGQHSCG